MFVTVIGTIITLGVLISPFMLTRFLLATSSTAGIAAVVVGVSGIIVRVAAGIIVGVVSATAGAVAIRAAFSIVLVQRFKTGYHFLLRIVLL